MAIATGSPTRRSRRAARGVRRAIVDTAVRVYEGEIEQLQSAQTEGIGIRVIKDGRVGFAYGGVLDEASVAEVLAEARDNVCVRHARRVGRAGRARRGGVADRSTSGATTSPTFATDDKVALAWSSSG